MDRSFKKRLRGSLTARLSFVISIFLAGVLIGRLGKPLLGESVIAVGETQVCASRAFQHACVANTSLSGSQFRHENWSGARPLGLGCNLPPSVSWQTPNWETRPLKKEEALKVVQDTKEAVKSAFSRADLDKTTHSSKSPTVRTVCENSCPTARDGVCQDGRPPPGSNATSFYETLHPVICDLGTDCADCGPWVTNASPEALAWTPVELLRSVETKLLVRRVASPAGYIFGITDPDLDTDVSRHVNRTGLFEPVLTLLW